MSLRSLEFDEPLGPEEIEEVTGRIGYASEDLTHFRIDPLYPRRVEYGLRPGADEVRSRAALLEVITAIRSSARRGETRVLWESRRPAGEPGGGPGGDARPELVRRGLLAELGRGQVALGGDLLLLAEGIDRAVLGMAADFSPLRFDYPTLIPLEVLVRARYLETFPQYITFACHLREDLDVLRQVVLSSWSTREADGGGKKPGKKPAGNRELSREHLGPLDHVLSPAVCLHAYGQFAGTEFALPTTLAARARCARYEAAGLGGPERLWEFTMREIVFFGPGEWVQAARERALERAIDLAVELDLSGRAVTATDAFFVDGYRRLAAFQRAFDTKYELRLDLPASGGSLAAASFNLHHDHFSRSFGLTFAGGAPLSTGCVGFGLERFAYAVACQHGADPSRWPARARELVEAGAGLPVALAEGRP
jgi:seryl-tRNA synthetase